MFKSTNFTNAERISLAEEIAQIGVQSTPLTSLLIAKGVEKATSTRFIPLPYFSIHLAHPFTHPVKI